MSSLVKLRVESFCAAESCAAEEFPWAVVGDAFPDDPAGVSGKAGAPFGCEFAFKVEAYFEEVEDEVVVFVVGDEHAPVSEDVVDDAADERFAVSDRFVVGDELPVAVFQWAPVGAADGSER